MLKRINKILTDKNDYHLDPSLKSDTEICEALFQATLNCEKNLISKKIRYFFKYDKLFFIKLFFKFLIKLIALLILLIAISISLLYIFNINVNFNKIEKSPALTIYIPSLSDNEKDSLNIIKYKKELGENLTYIIFYLKDPSKNYEKWKENLAAIESNGAYDARREGSQYWGKYQMGESARKNIGLENITWEKWRSNPELQEASLKLWIDVLYQYLKDDIKKYDGKFLNGWSITESGIIAMAHNVGVGPTQEFLYSGGKIIPKDGSGKDATRFLILGNYDLEINK